MTYYICILQIDSFTKLNSQLHATELRSSGKETPKFLICKYGEHPEDALPEKMRKAYEKKGLIKAVDIEPTDNDRYGDDEEQGYDQVEDGAPEPEKNTRRQPRNRDYDRSPSPQRHNDEPQTSRRGVHRYNGRDPSPSKQTDEPQTSRRPVQRNNGVSKSQSRENVASKQTTNRTPRQTGPPNKSTQRKPHPTRRQVEEETSSESQNNHEDSDSDSDYPEPRLVDAPSKNRARLDTPDY